MRIKFLFAVLALISFVNIPVQAQDEMETRHEVAVSYGTVPNSIWIDILTDVIKAEYGESMDSYKNVGPVALEYYYHTSPLIGVGAVAIFTSNNQNGFINDVKSSHTFRSYFSFMPSVKFNWLRKKNWGMYSKIAAGVTYAHFKQDDYDNGIATGEKTTVNDLLFNFHASLLGVEAGGQHVRGFAELGLGEQGVALAGIRYKF